MYDTKIYQSILNEEYQCALEETRVQLNSTSEIKQRSY